MTTSRVSEALLLASLTTALLAMPAVAGERDLIIVAMFLCVLLAGLWQIIFGVAGFAKIIKFTPRPVLVGFLNGVSVLVALSQLKPYFQADATRVVLTHIVIQALRQQGHLGSVLAFDVSLHVATSKKSLSSIQATFR